MSEKRERKTVDRLAPAAPEAKDEGVVIPAGSGETLGSIPSVEASLKKTADDDLKALHSVLFGKAGKSGQRKKSIKQFNGFATEDESREDKLAANKNLKEIAAQLALPKSGTKAEIAAKVAAFLQSPSSGAAGGGEAGSKKRKASSSDAKAAPAAKKGKKGEKGATIRPLSGYIVFSTAKRQEVKDEDPDMENKDIMRKLGEMWTKLSEKEKAKYVEKGEKDWKASGGPAAAAANKKVKDAEKLQKKKDKAAEKASVKDKPEKKAPAKKGKKAAKEEEEAEAEDEPEEKADAEEEADDAAEGDDDAKDADGADEE